MTKTTKPKPKAEKSPTARMNSSTRMAGYKAQVFEDHTFDDSDILADDYIHQAYCPSCGRANPINHTPEWLLNRFTGIMGRILAVLIEARRANKPLSSRDLQIAAYSHVPEGPPAHAAVKINEAISLRRTQLWELGWDIVGPQITRLGYQLVPLVENR